MIPFGQQTLNRRSRAFRYLYYVISNVRLISYSKWTEIGEPNPFLCKSYRQLGARRSEFLDLLQDLHQAGPLAQFSQGHVQALMPATVVPAFRHAHKH